jgi:hypothetical protein
MVREAVATASAVGATGKGLVRGDSAFGAGAVVGAAGRPARSSRSAWGDLRRDHPQPAPGRRRHPDQPRTCRGTRCDAPSPDRQRPRPDWLDPNDATPCTYRRTGPGPGAGSRSGATSSCSGTTPGHRPRPDLSISRAGPTGGTWKSWNDQQTRPARTQQESTPRSPSPSRHWLHGSRLSLDPWTVN